MNNINFTTPFGIYIHVPFCIRKCSYCDFYSQVYCPAKMSEYIQALKKEIKTYAGILKYRKIKTIYFGGGTPGLLTPDAAAEILQYINKYFFFKEQLEITLEANPFSLTKEKVKGYHQCGINRLSLGVQSFNDDELKLLDRMHSVRKAMRTLEEVSQVFANINIDLIFALPGQKFASWQENLQQAVKFLPQHISTYNLEIHEETPLGKRVNSGELIEIDEEIDARMYLLAREILTKAGYKQYEISSFALPGYEARHNKIYWQFEPYLGLGPAAHSFDGYRRFNNYADTDRYIKMLVGDNLPIENLTSLNNDDLMAEMVIMGLRLIKGVSKNNFRKRFGVCLEDIYQEELDKLIKRKLLINNENNLLLSNKGLLLGNQVFMEFL